MTDPSRVRFIARRAFEVRNYRKVMKILACAMGGLAVATIAIFMVSMLYSNQGSFTVSVGKKDSLDFGLILSEDRGFNQTTAQLYFEQADITNTAASSLPGDVDSDTGGTKSGPDYVAYTFFVKNSGKKEVSYSYELNFSSVTNNIDKATRIRLYVDGEQKTFARANKEGQTIEGTEQFYSETTVVNGIIRNFAPEEVMRFTVLIWLEGNDEECVDSIIGGEMKLQMQMSVIETE